MHRVANVRRPQARDALRRTWFFDSQIAGGTVCWRSFGMDETPATEYVAGQVT